MLSKMIRGEFIEGRKTESYCDLIVDHQQESCFLILLYFEMPLGKSPQRELNGAEDSVHHKTTATVMEQTIGNMGFT